MLRAGEEVDNALVGYVQQISRSETLTGAVDANRRAVEISQKQYEQGAVTFQRVLDSQRAQLLTEAELATSQANVIQNLISLYRALGGGWTGPAGVQPLPPIAPPEVIPPGATPDTPPAPPVDISVPLPPLVEGEFESAPPLERLPTVDVAP